ncbi:glycosyltransferase family 4 protein [Streptomyces luomodiensis]|uniref:D-inositol 3-phosphate glycosyltransferase n=1 Tax=Streptomyces luomodiensis TaxID=3026192 RepID=A0ABY9V9M7_9ACTN|nr:glycosyltransferase family 4 protein [Streptomyces sp. SCA4-21]WNF01484.1 glycosyltransferase family 4 protein [Streptomyces sp. SCA4-21]
MIQRRHLHSGVLFYPRGGSAQVIRYLLPRLAQTRWIPRHFAGSLGQAGSTSHARTFYEGIDVVGVDYNAAVQSTETGNDPIAAPTPMHPSYEDRIGAPDRIFAAVSPSLYAGLEARWQASFAAGGMGKAGTVHLHHLTPLQAAARAVAPRSRMVTTLHGTELKMLVGMKERVRISRRLGVPMAQLARDLRDFRPLEAQVARLYPRYRSLSEDEQKTVLSTRWSHWEHSEFWIEELHRYHSASDTIVTISDHDTKVAAEVFGESTREPVQIPNAVDVDHFRPAAPDTSRKLELLNTWLVDDAQGWKPGGAPGSIRYTQADVQRLVGPDGRLRPILMFVGRFLEFKNVPTLIRAFADASRGREQRPALLVWGGYPGEWENEHPYDVAVECEITEDVYFVGWRGHQDLPDGLAVADIMVAPSTEEPFGLVYLEAMATKTPVIATRTGGPRRFVVDGGENSNGWFAEPGNVPDLVDTIIRSLSHQGDIRRRAENGYRLVHEHYTWDRIAAQYDSVLGD